MAPRQPSPPPGGGSHDASRAAGQGRSRSQAEEPSGVRPDAGTRRARAEWPGNGPSGIAPRRLVGLAQTFSA